MRTARWGRLNYMFLFILSDITPNELVAHLWRNVVRGGTNPITFDDIIYRCAFVRRHVNKYTVLSQ